MITVIANLNAGLDRGDPTWPTLRQHEVTVTYRENGLFIERGVLKASNLVGAMRNNGFLFDYMVEGPYRTTYISPGDRRLVRLAHRTDQCKRCKALQLAMKEEQA